MSQYRLQTATEQDISLLKDWLTRQKCLVPRHTRPGIKALCEDKCLIFMESVNGPIDFKGAAGLSLSSGSIGLLALAPGVPGDKILRRLLQAIERLAVSYGMNDLDLVLESNRFDASRFPHYRQVGRKNSRIQLRRSLSRRLTRHARKALKHNRELGVPGDYGRIHKLQLQAEPSQLASIGLDVFKREQFMLPAAAKAFLTLQRAASADEISIQAVSAFRSMDYQAGLLQRKLEKGLQMDEILRVSAAPGYSEHHSGRAIDITTPGEDPLEESFANTAAFDWLSKNAGKHGFRMSYPRNNRHGVAYEPWHWYFAGAK